MDYLINKNEKILQDEGGKAKLGVQPWTHYKNKF